MKKILMALSTVLLIACGDSSSSDFTYVPDNAKPGVLYTMEIGELGDCKRTDTYNQLMGKCPSAFINVETWYCVSIDKISSVLASKYNDNYDAVMRHVNSIVGYINVGLNDFAYANINGTSHWVNTTRCRQ